jgi:hypothetical protein
MVRLVIRLYLLVVGSAIWASSWVAVDILLHVDDVFSQKLGNLMYYMTSLFIVGVTVACELVLFTLGFVSLTAIVDGLTMTPWEVLLQEPGCNLQGQKHRQAGIVADTDRAVIHR